MASDAWCAIHQPNLFPRLSTLAKLWSADTWVVLGDVQFTRQAYQQRCRLAAISDPAGQQWLTIPVHLPHGRQTTIDQVKITDPQATRLRVRRLLQQYYGRSRHWPAFEEAVGQAMTILDRTDLLADFTEQSSRALLTALGWRGTIVRSSQFRARDGRSERLARLTCAAGARTYLCGTGGARYLDQWPFASHGLRVAYFTTPTQGDQRIWQDASKITAIRALMTVGPSALSDALHQHAANLRQAAEEANPHPRALAGSLAADRPPATGIPA